jgi:hypothetical protein
VSSGPPDAKASDAQSEHGSRAIDTKVRGKRGEEDIAVTGLA